MPTCSSEVARQPEQPMSVEVGVQHGTTFPRLVYIGDVPIEESYGGSTQLFRLLAAYPQEKLLIIETNTLFPQGGRQLEGVCYRRMRIAHARFLRTRLHGWYGAFVHGTAPLKLGTLRKVIADFQPEAVMTVAHGFAWSLAHSFAQAAALPLHLIIHDDWRTAMPCAEALRGLVGRRFAAAYRRAATRHCISPYMEERYRNEFGVAGSVLPPVRGDDGPRFASPKVTDSTRPVYAFAGSLFSSGYRDLLFRFAGLLPDGSKLLLFSPHCDCVPDELRSHIEVRSPLATPTELVHTLRNEADVLFCPSSFHSRDRITMEINLPSKLTDYTAAGLPLLVWGPGESSAVRWARENSGAAVYVDVDDDDRCREAISYLADPGVRRLYAKGSIQVGEAWFSPQAAREKFYMSQLAAHRALSGRESNRRCDEGDRHRTAEHRRRSPDR